MMAVGIAIEVVRGTDGDVLRTKTARVVPRLAVKPVAHHA
jgi:hypothetical protein